MTPTTSKINLISYGPQVEHSAIIEDGQEVSLFIQTPIVALFFPIKALTFVLFRSSVYYFNRCNPSNCLSTGCQKSTSWTLLERTRSSRAIKSSPRTSSLVQISFCSSQGIQKQTDYRYDNHLIECHCGQTVRIDPFQTLRDSS